MVECMAGVLWWGEGFEGRIFGESLLLWVGPADGSLAAERGPG